MHVRRNPFCFSQRSCVHLYEQLDESIRPWRPALRLDFGGSRSCPKNVAAQRSYRSERSSCCRTTERSRISRTRSDRTARQRTYGKESRIACGFSAVMRAARIEHAGLRNVRLSTREGRQYRYILLNAARQI